PFIDMRKPLQGDSLFIDSLCPGLREAMAEKRAEPIRVGQLIATLRSEGLARLPSVTAAGGLGEFGARACLAAYAVKIYPEAKKALMANGWKPEVIEKMPVTQ